LCHTQAEIAEAVGLAQQTVVTKIAEIIENEQMTDSNIFRDFEGGGWKRKPAPSGAGLSSENSVCHLYVLCRAPVCNAPPAKDKSPRLARPRQC
jgi:hypothetical protein